MKIKFLLLVVVGLIAALILTMPASAQFNPVGGACQTDAAKKSPTCQQNSTQNGKETNPAIDIIRTAANIIAIIAGIGAVIMIIVSGFTLITAGGATPGQRSGDPNKIKSARATLTNAIIGIVIIALAWTIVTFVTDRLI
jgi:ABC-type Fe3+ transport system permease subunit